ATLREAGVRGGGGWGEAERVAPNKRAARGASRSSSLGRARALPLAELLPLHVGPDLLGHLRGADRAAAEHGLERVLAALEADVIPTDRLLALRHVASSLRLKVSRDVLQRPGVLLPHARGRRNIKPCP